MKRRGNWISGIVLTVIAASLTFGTAHPHRASKAHQGDGQFLANRQNHGAYESGVVCGGDPAAYGLESAHHGPDSGTPGKADGCYRIDGTDPALDDENPAID
jgi:hypothetical protein